MENKYFILFVPVNLKLPFEAVEKITREERGKRNISFFFLNGLSS